MDKSEPGSELPWYSFATVIGLAAISLALFGWGNRPLIAVETLIATAAMSAGGLLGFLFGIPRTVTRGGKADRTAEDVRSVPANNLEQVVDWLTKILVGAGLVEIGHLQGALAGLGDGVAHEFGKTPGVSIITQALTVTSLASGFIAGYVWTRLRYGSLQRAADDNKKKLEYLLERDASSARNSDPLSLLSDASAETRNGVERFIAAPPVYASDPAGDIFGTAANSSNGRTISGSIDLTTEKGLIIAITVSGSQMKGDVVVLLHPTLTEPVRVAPARNGTAETKFYSEGWFNVVALADNGKTVLRLDLRNVPNVPEWYKAQ